MTASPTVGMVYPSLGHGPTKVHSVDYGHPAHRGFARAVGADDIVLELLGLPPPIGDTFVTDVVSTAAASLPERDVYVLENDAVLYAAPWLRRRFPDATIVHLSAADRLIGRSFVPRPDDSRLRSLKRRANNLADNALLRRILVRYCDGAVAVSSFARDRIRSFAGPAFPLRVATPYVQPVLYESLLAVDPDLSATVAVMVGEWRDHKGADTIVEAWPLVRERHPGAELRIVGPGYPSEYADVPGITLRGYVEHLRTEFESASLYVHPAHIEAFGVSVIEAMRAGLPAIVTETTGARSAVRRVDTSMIVPPTPGALARAVIGYFDADIDRRRALSRASRRESEPFDEETMTGRFRRRFLSLIDDARPDDVRRTVAADD